LTNPNSTVEDAQECASTTINDPSSPVKETDRRGTSGPSAGNATVVNTLVWARDLVPTKEHLGRFILFNNVTARKKQLSLSEITVAVLHNWKDLSIVTFVHVHSNAVSNASLWSLMERTLLTPTVKDRSGAANNAAVLAYKTQLKRIHGSHYTAHDIDWYLWANYIAMQHAGDRDRVLNEAPPSHLIHLYRRCADSSDQRLRRTLDDVAVAQTISSRVQSQTADLRLAIDALRQSNRRNGERWRRNWRFARSLQHFSES
ncbi:hypothetical protein DFJ73DRAFT_870133, partial [Zopfochytrium polystomum]